MQKEVLLEKIRHADESMVKEYKTRFSYEYPYKQEMNKKSKYSVSELKHDSMVENYDRMEGEVEVPEFLLEQRESYIPDFAKVKEEMDSDDKTPVGVNRGALRGTAMHRVMECMDFAGFLEVDSTSRDSVEAKILMPDGTVAEGLAEIRIMDETNDEVQFERVGFVRIEKKDSNGITGIFSHR